MDVTQHYPDCVVVGGGLIGMLTARSLLERGLSVTVLERGPFGREASWAGGGILSPLYPWRHPEAVNVLALAGQRLYPALVDDVRETAGIDPEYWRCGLLMLAVDDGEQARAWADRHGIALQPVDEAGVRALEPSVRPAEGAWYLPDAAQVRNPRFIKAMREYLVRRGARLLPDSEVSAVETRAGRVNAVRTADGRAFPAGRVVIANGAWSGRLLGQMGIDLAVRPVQGQMVLLGGAPGMLQRVVLDGGHYLIPRRDGQIVVGSTVEDVGFEKATTGAAREELIEFAAGLLPALAGAPVREQWAGLRPGCGDGVPYIGEHPRVEGLYVNAGHYRNGIVMAPAAAELLAGLMSGETLLVDPAPYSPDSRRVPLAI